MTIRPATLADVPTILRFVRELAVYERAPDAVVATEAMLHDALFGVEPACEAAVADLDGAPAGFALWFWNFSTWTGRRGLYLEDLYVTPQARNRGVGRLLMAHAAATALARGCARMDWSVLDWNAPAVAMYRGLGAVAQDEWTVQRLEGAALARLAAFACPPSGGGAGTG